MARKKVRAKDIKKQRWAGIVAAVLALGMIVSLVGVYLGQAALGGRGSVTEQHSEPQPEDYLAYYQGEVNRLEDYIEEHEAAEAVLLELVENYRYLSFIQQVFFDNEEVVGEYDLRMITLFETLVEKDPSNLQYRLELLNLYLEKSDDRLLIEEEIAFLQETLEENPDPRVHLSLVRILSSAGEEEFSGEEAEKLYAYLDQKIAEGLADNDDLFYFAVLNGEYLDNVETAERIINEILDKEDEESMIYQEALNYLNYLIPSTENEDTLP